MIRYDISRITIDSFRGFHTYDMPLSSEAFTVLIGPNNAGKSNLLDALGLCLGSPKFSKYLVQDADFWTDAKGVQAESFAIEVHFTAKDGGQLPSAKGGIGDPIYVSGIRAGGERGNTGISRVLLDTKGDAILLNKTTPVSKSRQAEFRGQGYGGRRYATLMDIRSSLPDVWQLDAKNLFVSLYEWKSGPLQRLLSNYKTHLFEDKWETASKQKMPDALGKVSTFLRDQALLTPFWKNVLAPGIKTKLQSYLGSNPDIAVTPGLRDIDEWLLQELMVTVRPGAGLAPVDARRLGDGWQSLIRFAAMEMVLEQSEDEKRIFLLAEEPETYLHPHLRRKLRTTFARFQEAGHQCIVSTHAPELISFSEKSNIVRLTMTLDGTVSKEYSTTTAGGALKAEEKFHERGNHELVFASRVILTEGKSDQCAVALGLDAIDYDIDANSVSVVDCGSVDNLPDYAAVCSSLGIPWIAIHDKDLQAGGTRKPNTEASRKKLDAIKGPDDLILEWDNELEECVGFRVARGPGKADPTWLTARLAAKWPVLVKDSEIGNYVKVLEGVINWLQ